MHQLTLLPLVVERDREVQTSRQSQLCQRVAHGKWSHLAGEKRCGACAVSVQVFDKKACFLVL